MTRPPASPDPAMPRTAAGRALLQALKFRWRTHILAIEAEAARREAALREALRDLWVASDSDASPAFLKEVRKDVDLLLHDYAGAATPGTGEPE